MSKQHAECQEVTLELVQRVNMRGYSKKSYIGAGVIVTSRNSESVKHKSPINTSKM